MAAARSITPETLVALGAPALAAALIEHAENEPILRKKLRTLLAGTEGPGKLATELGKRIQTIGRSRSFVDWDKRKPLVQELDHIRTTIGTTLAAQNPAASIERMWDFIGIADRVLDRVGEPSPGGKLAISSQRAWRLPFSLCNRGRHRCVRCQHVGGVPPGAETDLERQRQRADRPLRGACGRPMADRRIARGGATRPLATFLDVRHYLPKGVPLIIRLASCK